MRRCYFGAALLVALLGVSLLATAKMSRLHTAIANELASAASESLLGETARSDDAIRHAREAWEKNWHLSAALSDHEPMEEVDALFAELEVYRATRDIEAVAAVCAQLSSAIDALGDAHECTWWNLL